MTEVDPYDDGLMGEEFPNSPSKTVDRFLKLETFRVGNVHLMISYRRMYSPLHSSGHTYGYFEEEDFTYSGATATIIYRINSDSEELNGNALHKQILIRLWKDGILDKVLFTDHDLHLELIEKSKFKECKIYWDYAENQRVDSFETLITASAKINDFIIDAIEGEMLDYDVLSSDEGEELNEYSGDEDDFNEIDDRFEDDEDIDDDEDDEINQWPGLDQCDYRGG